MSRGEKSYKLESKNPSLLARVGGGFNEPTTFAATLINTRRIPYSPIHAVHPDRYYKAIRGESHGTRFLSTVNGNRLTSGNRRQKLVNAHAFPLINSTRIRVFVWFFRARFCERFHFPTTIVEINSPAFYYYLLLSF